MERLNYIDSRKAGASYKFRGHRQASALTIVQRRILVAADRIITARRAGCNVPGLKHALFALIAVKRDLQWGAIR
jgi:hypothetical protein